jgi:hypothetical protein
MYSKSLKVMGFAALVAVSPVAVTAQMTSPPAAGPVTPDGATQPVQPTPMPPTARPQSGDSIQPTQQPGSSSQPTPEPLPPQSQGSTDIQTGTMETPRSNSSDPLQGSSRTSEITTPQPAAMKVYPPCTRTLQDNCRNPGEGPNATRKKRR